MTATAKRWISVEQAIELLAGRGIFVSPETIRRRCTDGIIESYKTARTGTGGNRRSKGNWRLCEQSLLETMLAPT